MKPLRAGAWAMLAGVVAFHLPPFLCMGLDVDAIGYDIQARCLRGGGVLYRDALEVNLPGAMWWHAAVRSVAGESSVALRAFDFAAFAATAWLLASWTCVAAASGWRALAMTASVWAYFSVSEWSHCQRDVWTLPLALLALALRQRHALDLAAGGPGANWRPFAEGLLWGAALWIKPFVVCAGVAAWALAAAWARPGWRRGGADAATALAGGTTVVVAGCVWLRATGAWPDFLDVMLAWNPEYARPQANAELLRQMFGRLSPWWVAHAVAAPIAARGISRALRDRAPAALAAGLPAALYLGWCLQALLLQPRKNETIDTITRPSLVPRVWQRGVRQGLEGPMVTPFDDLPRHLRP